MIKKHRTIIWAALLLAGTPSFAQSSQDVAKIEASARSGDAGAMVALGEAYAKGTGVAQDAAEADRLDKAADSPDPAKWRSFVAPPVALAFVALPLALASAPSPARAENWVNVYDEEPIWAQVDKASIRRGTDNLVYFTSEGGGKADRAADCQRRILYTLKLYVMGGINYPKWRDEGDPVVSRSAGEAILQYACANAG